jgi:hypothetical protein
MKYVRVAVVLLLGLVLLGAVHGQDEDKSTKEVKDKDKPSEKVRGQLPTYYKRLDLRADQRDKLLRLRASYRAKVAALRKQIDDLRAEESKALEKVLTPQQLKRLRELRDGK